MTLPSGTISMDQVRKELGKTSGSISLGDAAVRSLAGKPSGAISMNDLRGKSSLTVLTQVLTHVGGGFIEETVKSVKDTEFTKPSGYPLARLLVQASRRKSSYRTAFIKLDYTTGADADKLKASIIGGSKVVLKYGTSAKMELDNSNIYIMHPDGSPAISLQPNHRQDFYLFIDGARRQSGSKITIEIH
ncbi:TPA: hypothetical protein ACRZZI_004959 [Vibrio harveyi]